jgi:multidrug efflux pump subunit AcrA (membrane-fusion protein)
MDTRAPAADHDPEAQPAPSPEPTLVPRAPRASGSDRFDDAIVVTRTRAWIGLVCCLGLIGGIVAWAIFTTVGVTVEGQGIALTNGAIATVSSPASGTVQSMNVKVDDTVQAGQVIGAVVDFRNQALPLIAPVSGRVLNVSSDVGSTVRLDADVVSITQTTGPLLVRMFVTPAEAQEADLTTEAVLHFPEQSDVRGRVTSIGTLPMTKDQAADSIGSPALANLLVRSSAVINITITPDPSATNVAHIDNGDVASVTLIVGSKRPIDYVI